MSEKLLLDQEMASKRWVRSKIWVEKKVSHLKLLFDWSTWDHSRNDVLTLKSRLRVVWCLLVALRGSKRRPKKLKNLSTYSRDRPRAIKQLANTWGVSPGTHRSLVRTMGKCVFWGVTIAILNSLTSLNVHITAERKFSQQANVATNRFEPLTRVDSTYRDIFCSKFGENH